VEEGDSVDNSSLKCLKALQVNECGVPYIVLDLENLRKLGEFTPFFILLLETVENRSSSIGCKVGSILPVFTFCSSL